MQIKLSFDIDADAAGVDVQSLLASVRFLLRGFFPKARLRVSLEETPKDNLSCRSETPASTTLAPH